MKKNIVQKPWGYYEDYYRSGDVVCKKIVVNPGQRLSLQRHEHRDELWFIKQGRGCVEQENIEGFIANERVCKGSTIIIERYNWHRVSNIGKIPLIIYEMQCSTIGKCREDDIERISDDYGR